MFKKNYEIEREDDNLKKENDRGFEKEDSLC